MGTERLTGALLDRLTQRIHILEANGRNRSPGDKMGAWRKLRSCSGGPKGRKTTRKT
jgi:hypothetical protein